MRYIVTIRLNKENRTYLVDAADEAQVKERLLLRLPPNQRDKCQIDEIKIDPNSIKNEDPYGIFSGE